MAKTPAEFDQSQNLVIKSKSENFTSNANGIITINKMVIGVQNANLPYVKFIPTWESNVTSIRCYINTNTTSSITIDKIPANTTFYLTYFYLELE